MSILNKDALLSHGNFKGREIAIDIAMHAIKAVNTYDGVRRIINIANNKLKVGILSYDLSEIKNIFVFGAGKATMGQARALDEILGDRIKKGIVIVKKGQRQRLRNIDVEEGGHPVPDEGSFRSAGKILKACQSVSRQDLVFFCDSGGSTALMSHPAEGSGISFEDERTITHLLLMSGAPIYEMNAVRRHITAMKGGKLQQRILSKGTKMINFVVPDAPRIFNPSPSLAIPRQGGWEDHTTFQDAVDVLRRYDLWTRTPVSIRKHLKKGLEGTIPETPKDFTRMEVHTFTLGSIDTACMAAEKRVVELGFNSMILSTVLEGESREAGIALASVAREVEGHGRPVKPPCVLISGGETTVSLEMGSGEGGPSQELALGFAIKISGSKNITCLAIDTDGNDGPTDIAGGLVDGYTMKRARERGIDVFESLKNHNSSHVFKQLRDAVYTDYTDTNVCDLNIVVIGA